ncbi:hypothetical protein CCMSSC00406_0006647 [Pleurotus cornucopiae]|uniref:Uncharacterized protein n=1 Tax=Pleurotus cornucopiae TaxID=5321 RepID=A0ACB7IQA1_PLECO|nr:hypothetical protein CCMSSC00406_0006647 [Pleurotus cornucopiae]
MNRLSPSNVLPAQVFAFVRPLMLGSFSTPFISTSSPSSPADSTLKKETLLHLVRCMCGRKEAPTRKRLVDRKMDRWYVASAKLVKYQTLTRCEGIRWGPSRVRDGFLFYHEKETRHTDAENIYGATPISQMRHEPSRGLIKQTYSVYVDTTSGRKKWHLIAYFTEESLEYLRTVNDLPHLASLLVPQGRYKSARTAKGRIRDQVEDDYTPSSGSQLPPINSPISDTQENIFTDARRPSLPHPRNEYPRVVSERQSPPTPSTPKDLAPLAYLENIAPRPRHPVDEKLLMMFIPNLH